MVDLKSIVKNDAEITEEFPGYPGFEVTLCYKPRKMLAGIRKACVKQEFNRKTRQLEEVLDEEKFLHRFVESVIKGWKGLKVSYLQELVLVDTEDLDPEAEIEFTPENAVVLMEGSSAFDDWVTNTVTDVENFTKSKSKDA